MALVGTCSRYNADISHGEGPQMVMGEHCQAMEARMVRMVATRTMIGRGFGGIAALCGCLASKNYTSVWLVRDP